MTTRSNQLGASLDRAYQHWRERGGLESSPKREASRPPLTVAISRERGAAGTTIAKMLSEKLDWPLYHSELLDHIAAETGLQQDLLEELDERRPNWFSEFIKSFSKEKRISGAGYAILLHKLLAALYMKGNCVILGRGAAQVLPEDRTLRIRLVAPHEHRVRRMAAMLPPDVDAAKHVKQVDHDRRHFVKEYFHIDADECHGYDVTLDTSRFSLEDCCETIEHLVTARLAAMKK